MTVDEYLDLAPQPQQATLRRLRETLRAVLPAADEGLSYGVPCFRVGGAPVAGYAQFAGHCGYYPHSGTVLEGLAGDLEGYEWSKGTLRFPIDEPLPAALVGLLVEARLAELKG